MTKIPASKASDPAQRYAPGGETLEQIDAEVSAQEEERVRLKNDPDFIPAPVFSDEDLALRFANVQAACIRYVEKLGRWFVWDGQVWVEDAFIQVLSRARPLCRRVSLDCGPKDQRTARHVASSRSVFASISLARADSRIIASVDQFDANLFELNTPGGLCDLRTGKLRRHEPLAYTTKITAVAPDPNCSIDLWLKVLRRATGDDSDLQDYLQRLFGYSLTGSTQEHTLHFAYGEGANSKSTIFNAIIGCLGDYHRTAPIETFTLAYGDRHPTELAMLRGARLVTATETEKGKKWSEAKLKQLTGGDPIAARFMRQDFFEYAPQFTLCIIGNHRPTITSVDEAIRRRFHLIPFAVTIPAHERDPELSDKLKVEWPGILQWCVEGCLEWQKQGLNAPLAVLSATAEYFEAEDRVRLWFEECCQRSPGVWTERQHLYADWKVWAERNGFEPGHSTNLADEFERLTKLRPQQHPNRDNRRLAYSGVSLKFPLT